MALIQVRFFCKQSPKPIRNFRKPGFLDSLRVYVSGGTGGNGYPKFGGIGGQGGDVKAVAVENLTLNKVYYRNKAKRYEAPPGRHSSHNFILGVPASPVTIELPVGVRVFTDDNILVGELNAPGQELILARGGAGGSKKSGFIGLRGQSRSVRLDLKLIADVGLVGFPNAGKSTLLKAISKANPKIASYPFTTIKPNVGIIEYADFRQISMADLPGLIEGAYANKGMGHNFLKHVERTKLLLLVVDINGFQLGPQYPHRSCLETILLLNKELELYNRELLDKPAMLVLNKMDSENAHDIFESVKDRLTNIGETAKSFDQSFIPEFPIKFGKIMAISAKERPDHVTQVKNAIRKLLDAFADISQEPVESYQKVKEKISERGPRLV